jgi:CRP-like cAMP-binding protein
MLLLPLRTSRQLHLSTPHPVQSAPEACLLLLCCTPAGQLITIPGTPQRLLYFIARGYADLYMGDTLIDTLVAGDTFGEAVSTVGHTVLHACAALHAGFV